MEHFAELKLNFSCFLTNMSDRVKYFMQKNNSFRNVNNHLVEIKVSEA